MERGGSLRFLLLLAAGFFLFMAMRNWFGESKSHRQPLTQESQTVPPARAPEARCNLWSPLFHAEVRTHGGALTHFELLTSKYRRDDKPVDVSTTPDPSGEHEFAQQLMTRWRREGEGQGDKSIAWNVDYDTVDYSIAQSTSSVCELVYRDADVELRKRISTTGNPYELAVKNTLTNVSATPKRHAFSIDTVAWRLNSEVEGKMFRISPYVTHAECMPAQGSATRLLPTDFEPADFEGEHFRKTELNPKGEWYQAYGPPLFAAVSNAYFSHALMPERGIAVPACLLQIEERWDYTRYKSKGADPNGGALYRGRLAYPARVVAPKEGVTYDVLTYAGPKERAALAQAGSGEHRMDELIDLGFFASIAKVLVRFLLAVHGIVPNWGIAIIVLTLTARILLFPLSLPSIKNMIRMREVKPEMDAIAEKYKDDPQARGLAQMELWRKHNVNPFKGCLPQLASMPVWFALYTTLQTAVELYNIPFLWFPDLSQRDPLFILPLIIGGTYFVQQRLMPMQGGDPMQQKMMQYFMPGMFTVLMLFLPAGLGVYMFTNSLLAITQQWAVERHAKRVLAPAGGGPGGDEIEVRVKDDKRLPGKNRRKTKNGTSAA